MATTDLKATGFDEVQALLAKMAGAGGVRAAKVGMRSATRVSQDAVILAAPERPSIDGSKTALAPGAFKRGIRRKVAVDDAGNVVGTVFPSKETAHVQDFVEFGHRNRQRGDRKFKAIAEEAKSYTPPHPFWRPAEESSQQAAGEAFVDAAGEDIALQWKEGK